MTFADKLRKDKSFRWKAILIFIVAVIVIGNYQGDMKKEAPLQTTCDQLKTSGISSCINAGCAVTAGDIKFGLDFAECIAEFGEGVALSCNNNPSERSTKTFMAKDLNQANDLCGTAKKAINAGTEFCFKTLYTCTDIPEEEQCSNKTEKTLAGFLNSVEFADDFTCNQKYLAVAFGGGLLAVILVLSAL